MYWEGMTMAPWRWCYMR